MTSRVLSPAEWPALDAETGVPAVAAAFAPHELEVVAVEDGARIVGAWSLLPFTHLEGLWIHPDYRGKSAVARRLLAATRQQLQARGDRRVMTAALPDDTRVQQLLRHLGARRVRADHYVISVGDTRCL